jgi:hypothetical protein
LASLHSFYRAPFRLGNLFSMYQSPNCYIIDRSTSQYLMYKNEILFQMKCSISNGSGNATRTFKVRYGTHSFLNSAQRPQCTVAPGVSIWQRPHCYFIRKMRGRCGGDSGAQYMLKMLITVHSPLHCRF